MASTVILPPKQRGLKHVDQILARSLPKLTRTDCSTVGSSPPPARHELDAHTPPQATMSPTSLSPTTNAADGDSDEDVVPCYTYYTLSYLPLSPNTEPFYTSGVDFGQQPGWNLLSNAVRQQLHVTRLLFTIYAQRCHVDVDTSSGSSREYSPSSSGSREDTRSDRSDSEAEADNVARSDALQLSSAENDVVVLRGILDFGKMMFVTKSLSQLYELHDLPHVSTLPGKAGQVVVLVKCHDGVFCPILEEYNPEEADHRLHQPPTGDPVNLAAHQRQVSALETLGTIATSAPPSPAHHKTSGLPSGSQSPASQPLEVSVSKQPISLAATSTSRLGVGTKLGGAALPREESAWDVIDGDVVKDEERRTQQRVEVSTLGDFSMLSNASLAIHRMRQIAKFQRDHLHGRIAEYVATRDAVSKIAAKKQATLLRCENVRERIQATKVALARTRESHSILEIGCGQRTENVEVDQRVLEERQSRCDDRALGSRSELKHMRSTVVKVQKRVICHVIACFPIADNTICGYKVPEVEPETEEHAIALGLAAHLFQGYCTTFGFHIPHPLYVCSSRSYICEHAAVAAEKRYPLFPSRSERAQMRKGITLLHGNIAAAAFGIHRQGLGVPLKRPSTLVNPNGLPAMHDTTGNTSGNLTLLEALARLLNMEGPEVEPQLMSPRSLSEPNKEDGGTKKEKVEVNQVQIELQPDGSVEVDLTEAPTVVALNTTAVPEEKAKEHLSSPDDRPSPRSSVDSLIVEVPMKAASLNLVASPLPDNPEVNVLSVALPRSGINSSQTECSVDGLNGINGDDV